MSYTIKIRGELCPVNTLPTLIVREQTESPSRLTSAIPSIGGDGYGGDGAAIGPDDVCLWRDERGNAHASVEHVVRHSPTGIEWGYRGSGPADLAYSVLVALTDEATAARHYVAFKHEVIAAVPDAGGVIYAVEVWAWLRRAATSNA